VAAFWAAERTCHWAKSFFWDGLIVDGVWGTVKGLGALVGFGGWDAMTPYLLRTTRAVWGPGLISKQGSPPESKIPAPPKQPGDIVLDMGDPLYFQDGRTAIGYDRNTMVNFDKVQPLDGYHDVVVHGNNHGFFEPGRVNESGVGFFAGDTHPTHIADAIRANPSYQGGPVRLISCHTGTGTVADGVADIPAAEVIANELGVPVMPPTNKVGVSSLRGPDQTPRIANNGYRRTYLPLAR
jgi:hypothetical protein